MSERESQSQEFNPNLEKDLQKTPVLNEYLVQTELEEFNAAIRFLDAGITTDNFVIFPSYQQKLDQEDIALDPYKFKKEPIIGYPGYLALLDQENRMLGIARDNFETA